MNPLAVHHAVDEIIPLQVQHQQGGQCAQEEKEHHAQHDNPGQHLFQSGDTPGDPFRQEDGQQHHQPRRQEDAGHAVPAQPVFHRGMGHAPCHPGRGFGQLAAAVGAAFPQRDVFLTFFAIGSDGHRVVMLLSLSAGMMVLFAPERGKSCTGASPLASTKWQIHFVEFARSHWSKDFITPAIRVKKLAQGNQRKPQLVFGWVREGAFDSKAPSRNTTKKHNSPLDRWFPRGYNAKQFKVRRLESMYGMMCCCQQSSCCGGQLCMAFHA